MKTGIKKAAIVLSSLVIFILIGVISTVLIKAEVQVKSIQIKKYPTKCAYNIGDGYSINGMVVEAKMSDGKTETVDNANITSFSGAELTEGRPFEQEGWKNVTIRYKGVETSYGIAVFDPAKEYSIKFDSNGGNAIAPIKIDASTKAFNLPEATKSASTFLGWYHSNGQKYTKYVPGMGPNLEFKANWGYKITFNANGGKGTMKNGVISKDYTLPKCGFKRTGYKFVGWSTSRIVTQVNDFYVVGDSSGYINSKKNITLYAQWVKPASYSISYSAVKGTKIPAKVIKKYTSGKTTMLPNPELTGDDNFVGWIITKNGKNYGPYIEIPPYMTGNIKVTPKVVPFVG